MGQYRQWLHYREIDQQLQGQLEALEQELTTARAQISQLEYDSSYAENPIIQALIGQHAERLLAAVERKFHTAQPVAAETTTKPVPSRPSRQQNRHAQEEYRTMSAALMAWGGMPNFTMQEAERDIIQRPASSTHPQEHLLPDDVNAFVDANSTTDPQIKLPWWLREAARRSLLIEQSSNSSPVDQQSMRTNHLVQRWFARWGEQVKNAEEVKLGKSEGEEPHGYK